MQDALYQARILDHYKHPRNKRVLAGATVEQKANNPSCGDTLTLYLVCDSERITQATFTGEGCAISQASASLLTEKLCGVDSATARAFSEHDMYTLLGVAVHTGRAKCALLAWRALQDALRQE